MGLENDDIEFEQLLQNKRHLELVSQLKKIVESISNKQPTELLNIDNSMVVEAINKQSRAIEDFVKVILNIYSNSEKKEQPISVNQEKVVSSVNEMSNSILNSLNDIKVSLKKEDKKEKDTWVFEFKRNDYLHYIEKVVATKK